MSNKTKYEEFTQKHGVCFDLFLKIHLAFHNHSVELAMLFAQFDAPGLYHEIDRIYTMLPAQILHDIGQHFGLSPQQTVAILQDCEIYLQTIGAAAKPKDLH